MPSGSVTKKVALFELPIDGKSQLKRKHAIKRKNRNYCKNVSQCRPHSSAEILSDGFSDYDGHMGICRNSIASYRDKLSHGKENNGDNAESKSTTALTIKQNAELVPRSDFALEHERTFKERVNGVSKQDVLHADVHDKNNSAKSPSSLYGTKNKRHDIKTVSLNTVFLFSGSFTALDALEFDNGKIDNNIAPQENSSDSRSTLVVSSSQDSPKLALWSAGEDIHPKADGAEFALRRSASVDNVFSNKKSITEVNGDEDDEEPFYEELDTIYNQLPGKAHTLDRMHTDFNQTFTDFSGHNEMDRQRRLPDVDNRLAVGAYQVTSLLKDDEDETQLALLQASPSYESLYSELVYDNGSHSGKSGKDLSLPLPPPPSSVYSDIDGSYNNSNSSFDQSSSSNYSAKTTDKRSNSEVYGFRTLPPPPPSSSSSVQAAKKTSKIIAEAPNKFSSMAKTAGRKIAKKLLSMRRPSQSSFDMDSSSIRNKYQGQQVAPMQRRASSPCPSVASSAVLSSSRVSESGSTTGSRSAVLPRRSLPTGRTTISRPPVPPPAPPTNLPPASPPPVPPTIFVNNINGLERLNSLKDGESKYGQTNPLQQRISSDFDDYEDSDFYDSDSELIRNFVSAVQPIYSMEEEPLYQYYTYGISLKPEDDYQPVIPKNLGLTLDLLVPRVGQRTLWCELPEVISSGILTILSDKQKQWQEAIFEILTSEVSYLKSLDVLISLFYESQDLCCILTTEEMKCIYGNIAEVKACSQAFLSELLSKWEESWYIQEIGQTVKDYALNRFLPYVEYCRNKPYQDKMLQKLRLTNDDFVSAVKRIEENPKCQMLRMDSFLMLPMQRITRLPLLVNAVIQRTQSLKEKAMCEEALASLTNLVLECNDAARESQDAEETAAIVEKIEFPRYLKNSVTLGQFVMKNDFMKNPLEGNNQGGGSSQLNWTFRKSKRILYWLVLFSNQLLVTKKKSSGKFEVIEAVPTRDCHIKPLPNIDGVSKDFNHFFMLHFDNRETVHFLGAKTQSEVERWRQKLDSLRGATKEKIYQVIFAYEAQRDDEVSLEVGEKIHVSQMQPDGWYFGTKLSNNKENGWFPGNYCNECS